MMQHSKLRKVILVQYSQKIPKQKIVNRIDVQHLTNNIPRKQLNILVIKKTQERNETQTPSIAVGKKSHIYIPNQKLSIDPQNFTAYADRHKLGTT